jgi:SAM-dependent methyltransferase
MMQNASTQYDKKLACAYGSRGLKEHPQNMLPYITWKRKVGNVQGLSVLDLGCGDGHTSRILVKMGAKEVVGVDKSPDQIAMAREIEKREPLGITYHLGDVADLDLGRTFDLVTPTFLFHYAETKDNVRRLMRKTADHLRPNGRMVALSANPKRPAFPRLKNASHYVEWEGTPNLEGSKLRIHFFDLKDQHVCDFHYYHWKRETYDRLLGEAGFKSVMWFDHSMPEEMKAQFVNWQALQQYNASAVIVAWRQ